MSCKKCQLTASVFLRKKDYYCGDCFLINTNHKFRACLGKNKIISSNDKVLVCLSGGLGSTVLLDLIFNGLKMDNHKKLRIVPYFLHLSSIDSAANISVTNHVIQQCKKYDFDVHVAHISNYINFESELPGTNCLANVNKAKNEQLSKILRAMSSTSRQDFLEKVKHDLYRQYACLMNCKFVFTAETTTTLAINLLSNLAIGRGSQVENDIGFADSRDDKAIILRPMKDISNEELHYYIQIKKLSPLSTDGIQDNSLQSTIGTFVTDLQQNFQSTISTVCKTADKLGVVGNADVQHCHLCKSPLIKTMKLTALEATNFSSIVSDGNLCQSAEINELGDEIISNAIFPFVNKHLCYACSRNYKTISCLHTNMFLIK